MKGVEFKRAVEKLAKARGLDSTWNPSHGKGSHGRLTLSGKATTLKDLKKEIGKGLLTEMCKQLGITKEELTNV